MEDSIIKVLIIDDEHLIRNLLKKCIDWSAIGMEIVAEASCGEDAVELVDKYRPELIFTDICMTSLDGIDFSDIVIKKYPSIKIVVITGYDDFKYAQRSIKAGIRDYLLKPINDEILLSTALKMKKLILEEQEASDEYNTLKEQVAANLPFFKERLFNRLIGSDMDLALIGKQMSYMNFHFESDKFQVAAIELIFRNKHQPSIVEQEIAYSSKILDKLQNYFIQYKNIHIFFDMNYRIIILSNADENILEKVLEDMKYSIMDTCKFTYCIGVGTVQTGILNIQVSYKEALLALNYRMIAGNNLIIKYNTINLKNTAFEAVNTNIYDKLKIYLLGCSKGNIDRFIDNMFMQRDFLQVMSMDKVKEEAFHFTSIIVEVLRELGMDTKVLYSEKFFQTDTIPDMKQYLKEISAKAIDMVKRYNGKKSNKLINDIKDYLKVNLSDHKLSLSKVAHLFFINPSYLSRIFKKEVGLNFMEYVTKIRIDKALILLRTSDLKAYQIGEEVGFIDSSYFSTCFKKYTGLSVSEYKKSQNS